LIAIDASFSSEGCGKEKSCWFHPPGCAANNIQKCSSSVQWTVLKDGVLVQLEASLVGLDPDMAHYVALGISKDMRMGDDSVVECVIGADGVGKAFISFNDETNNQQLLQASEVMLSETSSFVEDGHMICNMKWAFNGRSKVNEADLFKVFDLESRTWNLLFARGNADKRSGQKEMHSVNDGDLFPWISEQTVAFCRENCTTEQYVIINEMKQTDVTRYWRYRFAVMHGALLLLAWWILGSSAILIARYFKPVWPRKKLFGTAVWFQLHRDLAILSVIIQIVAVFLIIYQAGRLYECSYECGSDDWSKKMHVITGIAATALAIAQPLIAFVRPGPNSSARPTFNWLHWFVGMSAWTFASVTMVLAVPMGKTGLQRVYGHAPTWIMAAYIIVFLVCNILLEIFSSNSERRFEKIGPSGMALGVINGPTVESPVARSVYGRTRMFIFVMHLVIAFGVAITITVMLVKILLSHSP
uniref:Cytochrome b561 domain-containing protein n=1 Tax=Ascaris lumbricoides TaxID=6252 RepID=A0A9J2P3T1_ASCLU